MNKLQEYIEVKKAEFANSELNSEVGGMLGNFRSLSTSFAEGFDAAIALDLPVKFLLWASHDYVLNDENPKNPVFSNVFKKEIKTGEELYQYWIDNVYKPE